MKKVLIVTSLLLILVPQLVVSAKGKPTPAPTPTTESPDVGEGRRK